MVASLVHRKNKKEARNIVRDGLGMCNCARKAGIVVPRKTGRPMKT